MSVNYNWLCKGKRPMRVQVQLRRRAAHDSLTAPAVLLHFQPTMTISWTEGGCQFAIGEKGGITEMHRQGGRC